MLRRRGSLGLLTSTMYGPVAHHLHVARLAWRVVGTKQRGPGRVADADDLEAAVPVGGVHSIADHLEPQGVAQAVVLPEGGWPARPAQIEDLEPGAAAGHVGPPAAHDEAHRFVGGHPWPPQLQWGGLHRSQMEAITRVAAAAAPPLVVAGDFNAAPWSHTVGELAERGGVRPVRRSLDVSKTFFPFPGVGLPLDHVLVSDAKLLAVRNRVPEPIRKRRSPMLPTAGASQEAALRARVAPGGHPRIGRWRRLHRRWHQSGSAGHRR